MPILGEVIFNNYLTILPISWINPGKEDEKNMPKITKNRRFITYSQTPYENNDNLPMISSHLVGGCETASLIQIHSVAATCASSGSHSNTLGAGLSVCGASCARTMSVSSPTGATLSMSDEDARASLNWRRNETISIDEDIHKKSLSYQNTVGISDLERSALEYALQTNRDGSEAFVLTESDSGKFCQILSQENIMWTLLSESGIYDFYTHSQWRWRT